MYFPAAQIVQAEPASLYSPTPQMSQTDTLSWSVGEVPEVLFPASQSSHEVDAILLWYFPTGHVEQEAEVAWLYWPAAHDEQAVEAVPLYWPALQSVQAEDSTPVAE